MCIASRLSIFAVFSFLSHCWLLNNLCSWAELSCNFFESPTPEKINKQTMLPQLIIVCNVHSFGGTLNWCLDPPEGHQGDANYEVSTQERRLVRRVDVSPVTESIFFTVSVRWHRHDLTSRQTDGQSMARTSLDSRLSLVDIQPYLLSLQRTRRLRQTLVNSVESPSSPRLPGVFASRGLRSLTR